MIFYFIYRIYKSKKILKKKKETPHWRGRERKEFDIGPCWTLRNENRQRFLPKFKSEPV